MKTARTTVMGIFALTSITSAAFADDNGISHSTTIKDGVGCNWINGSYAVAMSPDETRLFAVAYDEDAIVPFTWDGSTETLTCLENKSLTDLTPGSGQALNGATDVVVSPVGDIVYVAASLDDSITSYSYQNLSQSGLQLSQVFNAAHGCDGLDGVRSIAVDSTGSVLYAAAYTDDALAIIKRDDQGTLTCQLPKKHGNTRDGLNGATNVVVSADDQFVYVAGYVDDSIAIYGYDYVPLQQSPTLMYKGYVGTSGGPRNLAMSHSGLFLVSANYVDDSVDVFERDPLTGALHIVEREKDGFMDIDSEGRLIVDGLQGAWDVAFGPNDAYLFVTGAVDDAIAVFAFDSIKGHLTYLGIEQDGVNADGLNGARGLAVSSAGLVFTSADVDDAVSVFVPAP